MRGYTSTVLGGNVSAVIPREPCSLNTRDRSSAF
jgi:hypothetical protein